MHVVKTDFGGRELSIETGRMAKLANGAVVVRYGDSMVLVTATGRLEPKPGANFFPLTVDYQEKFYSAGKIPGGFFKREGRPSFKATLTSRLIDRPIRPLFPEGYVNETHIVSTTLSVDTENAPDVMSLIGASAALEVSDLPFMGPVAGCRVGRINGEFVINPSPVAMVNSDIDILVAGTQSSIVMVEGGALEVSEDDVVAALEFAHKAIQPVLEIQLELKRMVNKPKISFKPAEVDQKLVEEINKLSLSKIAEIFTYGKKQEREEGFSTLCDNVVAEMTKGITDAEELDQKKQVVVEQYEKLKEEYARGYTLREKKRIDNRLYDAIRKITTEVAILPRVHGSALFTRGETQALVTTTLGTGEDEQRIDSIEAEASEAFMLHYNFPPFSVGETGFLRGPGRREIGHGALAHRAILPVVPLPEKFPYTIRVVSEILESNGSSSMASVCGATLALLDAGVPISSPVAGIAMGLIMEGDEVAILSDILGDEDHLGDMDFKVAGTAKGVTAVQMDIKISGVSRDILEKALRQAREGRLFILSKMNETISEPRSDISRFAPRIKSIPIKADKIGALIGPGGKTIRAIMEETGAKIDIDDKALTVQVASPEVAKLERAVELITNILAEAEIGKIYEGKVVRIADFGAFVEILPGIDGLVHISELVPFRVNRVTDIVNMDDKVRVKVLDIDQQGKIRLSRKACLTEEEMNQEKQAYDARVEQAGVEGGQGQEPYRSPYPSRDYGRRRDFDRGGRGGGFKRGPYRGGRK
ncbi:MAG: polyribonucleotide nucleotidyltransferase [Deltaproteobacteria bacterium RIFCSPHIGHO2_12_FULL_43_9]|nr:MAG: polyribonucleotide nucleotidyltransferase [Deltaproteobacteria bacterium RIFCSPHIGHO2_12_FULL_43_9]